MKVTWKATFEKVGDAKDCMTKIVNFKGGDMSAIAGQMQGYAEAYKDLGYAMTESKIEKIEQ